MVILLSVVLVMVERMAKLMSIQSAVWNNLTEDLCDGACGRGV